MKRKTDAQIRVLVALHGTNGEWITVDDLRKREKHFTIATLEALAIRRAFPNIEIERDEWYVIDRVRLTKWGIKRAEMLAARASQ